MPLVMKCFQDFLILFCKRLGFSGKFIIFNQITELNGHDKQYLHGIK